MTDQPTTLVFEDDAAIQRNIPRGLTEQGYRVVVAGTTEEARNQLVHDEIDLVVLDLGLPDGSGLEALKGIRARGSAILVTILTARDKITDKVAGLDLGADDYLTKPHDLQKLSARIRANLRRSNQQASALLQTGVLAIDLVASPATRAGRVIEYTPRSRTRCPRSRPWLIGNCFWEA